MNKLADAAMAAVAAQAWDRIAAANRDRARFPGEGHQPSRFRGSPDPFGSALCPAQSDDRRGVEGIRKHMIGLREQFPQWRPGKAGRRRGRFRCRACSCHADVRRSRSCHRRHLPPGGRQDRRALGGAAARPGDGSARQRDVLTGSVTALAGSARRSRVKHERTANGLVGDNLVLP